ncbi:MAG: hypothetical protein RR382_10040 [Tannerellaceae bacterium]
MKQQQDVTEKKIVDQKSHVSHELTERQIDGSVKRGMLILKSAELFCMDRSSSRKFYLTTGG